MVSTIPKIPFIDIQISEPEADYALLDSGGGLKLEQFGQYRLIRPEPEAFWKPALSKDDWNSANAEYISGSGENQGHWSFKQPFPEKWIVKYSNLSFFIERSASRHVGIFPEQAPQWDFIRTKLSGLKRQATVLNLFGYTGAATIAAAQAGAAVTHVDASKRALAWAKENQHISGLADAPIRWIVDDAFKFVQREIRRANRYDGLILDPPKFGRGPKGEVWEFYKVLPALLENCRELLSKDAVFVILTAYAVKASSISLYEAMNSYFSSKAGKIICGELVQREKAAGRLLPRAIYALWQK